MKAWRPGPAVQIALIYALVAGLWILFSDRLLSALAGAPERITPLQTTKGLFFVAVTGLMLYALVRRELGRRSQAEQAHAESERVLATLASNLPGMAYRCRNDRQWTMEFVSEGCLELTGYPAEDLLENRRASYDDVMHPDDREPVWEQVQAAVREGRPFQLVYRITTRSGEGKWVWEQGRSVSLPGGRTVLEGFIADITERKRAEEEAERHSRELALLNRVITAASGSLKVEEVLAVACRELALTFGVPQAGAALADEDGSVFSVVAEYGTLGGPSALGTLIPVEGNPSLQVVIERRQPLAVADAQHDPRLEPIHDVMRRRGVASLLIVPLIVRGKVVGTIGLDSAERREFSDEEVTLAANVAFAVSQALHNARLYEALENANLALEQAVAGQTAALKNVKERVEAILDNSPDAILLLRPDGAIETANRTFGQLFGLAAADAGGVLGDLVALHDTLALNRALRLAVERGRVMRLEVTARRADGSTFDAGLALAPFEEGGETRIVCSLRDISALKEVERMKDTFVSNVSHELRTPIASLKLHHDLMKLNPGRSEVYMQRQEREIARLSAIIEGLLALSRIDHDRIGPRPAPVDVNRMVAEYVADRGVLAEQGGLALSLDVAEDLPPVEADHGMIGQVLGILLTNAFSYTPAGGHVSVRTAVCLDGQHCWVGFSVEDDGPGILPEELPYLFDRFFRGQAAKESGTPGTGLGLTIAREIVQRHRGWIEAKNNEAGGASFQVWLPACEEESGE